MAEVLGTAASALAIIELAAKLAKICTKYISSVKHAKEDILRMHAALLQLHKIYTDARQKSIEMGSKLPSTKGMIELSNECFGHLNQLLQDLEIPSGRRWAAKMIHLKWPLRSAEVDKEIRQLDGYCQRIQAALQVDTISILDSIGNDNILSKLAWAEGATYDAFEDVEEANTTCLKDTRVDLLKEIRDWIADKGSETKSIFWLCGMAGTGKSTISRTLATALADEKQLCASFFFKAGEGDRGGAKRFFTTLAAQMVRSIPLSAQGIRKALEDDPQIGSKALKEQFEKLILNPLSMIKNQRTTPLVFIIDALDECEPDWHVEVIVGLFSELRNLQPLQIRVFVTSRPERAPRNGFQEITSTLYHDLILHEIPKSIIEHDISIFLAYQFAKIRKKRVHDLAEDWPGEAILSTLTAKSQPLFIYASTICRFIGTGRYPESRLEAILLDQNNQAYDKVHQTYQPILDRLLEEHKGAETDQQAMIYDFQEIVGPIVAMSEPLPMYALGKLLNIDIRRVRSTLDDLQSVIHVPANPEYPVRPLHLSFPNFLLDEERRDTHMFWLDKRKLHKHLAHKCIDILLSAECLSTPDICQVKLPATFRSDIPQQQINQYLPHEVRYACQFWTHHLIESDSTVAHFQSSVSSFLNQRFLLWFEALSLLGRSSEMIAMLEHLTTFFGSSSNPDLPLAIYDAKRFVLTNSYIADLVPSQIYSSCIIFAPKKSRIRMKEQTPKWLGIHGLIPEVLDTWGPCQQALIGHASTVNCVAYSPDGKLLASGSNDYTVKLWHADSGRLLQSLDQGGPVDSVTFSLNGKSLISASPNGKIRLWDTKSSQVLQTLVTSKLATSCMAFSHDGMHLACGMENGAIQIWKSRLKSLTLVQTLTVEGCSISAVVFSPDGSLLASSAGPNHITLWSTKTWELCQSFSRHDLFEVVCLAISPDAKLLASASEAATVGIWDLQSSRFCQLLEYYPGVVHSMTFSPSGKLLVLGSADDNIRILEVGSWNTLQVLAGHVDLVTSLAFSADGTLLVSGSSDSTIRLWRIDSESLQHPASKISLASTTSCDKTSAPVCIVSEPQDTILDLQLESPVGSTRLQSRRHGNCLASSSLQHLVAYGGDDEIILWDVESNQIRLIYVAEPPVRTVLLTFSPDGQLLACGTISGGLLLFDVSSVSPRLMHTTVRHTSTIYHLVFSADQKLLASSSEDRTINVWDVASMQVVQTIPFDGSRYDDLSFHDILRWLDVDSGSYLIDSSVEAKPLKKVTSLNLSLEDDWLMVNDTRLLWLPRERRDSIRSAVDGNSIAFGTYDAKFGYFEIVPEELERIGILIQEEP